MNVPGPARAVGGGWGGWGLHKSETSGLGTAFSSVARAKTF